MHRATEDVNDADIRAAQVGDDAAFARVYRATQPWLVKYVRALAGTDVEDVCAETWVHVCRDLAGFKGDLDGFRAWVARIARNRAIDHARARRRRPAELVPPEALRPAATEVSGEDAALAAISTEAAISAIAALPREQAEAVLLRVVVGLDAKAAAKVVGKRPGAIRTAAYRGLRTLAEKYERPPAPLPAPDDDASVRSETDRNASGTPRSGLRQSET